MFISSSKYIVDQSDSIVGKAIALHLADPGSIPSIPNGWEPPSIPEYNRARLSPKKKFYIAVTAKRHRSWNQ